MKKLFSIFSLLLFFAGITYGQAAIEIPFTVTDNVSATVYSMKVGLDPTATDGIDIALGEIALPPWGPTGVFEARWMLPPDYTESSLIDIRNVPAFPFTGTKSHRLKWQLGTGASSLTINYELPTEATITVVDLLGGVIFNSGVLSGTGSYTINTTILSEANVTLTYTNIEPIILAPVFTIDPPSLDFGTINVGANTSLNATVTNTGNLPLIISNVISSDPQFTFTPNTFPVEVIAGGNTVFNVTFTPTAGGLQSANMQFTHNAAGSPTSYALQGTGHVPAPVFGVAPSSLDFGSIEVGNTSLPQQLTVTNTGDAALEVTLLSGNAQFAVSPTTLVTIPAGGNSVFNVTFTPAATGLQSAVVTFDNNAGAPVDVPVQGTGFTTAPFFSMSPLSLDFGQTSVGQSGNLPVTITNTGDALLVISNIASSNPLFTFAPGTFPINIPVGGNTDVTVTFTPVAAGLETGNITFTHNATGSPSVLPVSGTGRTQGGELKFIQQTRNLPDGTTNNEDIIMLSGYTGQPLKALQFNLLVGKTGGKLVLQSVVRGAAIANETNFNFTTEIYEGTVQPDGSSIDTVRVVILGYGLAGELPVGTPDLEIMKFYYNIVQITGPYATTYNSLTGILGATSTPVANANITGGPDEIINIYNGTPWGLLGDVNLDDHVDLLDILLMIDHILGRVTLTGEAFDMGDISPWTYGQELPNPDGVINVMDLAVLENIVLTQQYPSGIPVYKMLGRYREFYVVNNNSSSVSSGMNAKVTFYVSNNGISVNLKSLLKVKGLQIDLSDVNSVVPENTSISSTFNQTMFHQNNSEIRMLVFDSQSIPLNPGEYMAASLPFKLSDYKKLQLAGLIVAGEHNDAMQNIEVEMIYEDVNIPQEYMLYQNYPNPFNPATSVRFSVPKDEFVTIKVYDMLGQEVATIFSEEVKTGIYTINWNGLDMKGNQVSSGSYLYRMVAGDFVQSKKMIFLK